MAYNKKTWLARLGQGLNKFSIDGATPVPIINQPDSVTQQGDALSAGNLNDLEQRIADAFDDVEESKADKSTTDALQSQINQHESRLENLEQKAGDYTTVQYRGTDAVPTGKAKNGLVEKIVGKSRAWNQLADIATGSAVGKWHEYNYSTSVTADTANDKIIVKSRGSLGRDVMCRIATIGVSHAFLFSATLKNNYTDREIKANIYKISSSSGSVVSYTISANSQIDVSIVINSNLSDSITQLGVLFGDQSGLGAESTISCDIIKPVIRDLSVIFPEGVPSTVAECVQKCPDLLKHNAYDAGSLVSTEVSGVKSVGKNIFNTDEILSEVSGWAKGADGIWKGLAMDMFDKYSNGIPQLKIRYGERYTLSMRAKNTSSNQGSLYIGFYYTDGTRDRILVDSTSFNTYSIVSTSSKIIAFIGCSYSTNAEVQIEWIQLEVGTSATAYSPYKTDTLSLSETVTLRSAGSVAEVYDLVTGEKTNPIRRMTFGDDTYWTKSNDGVYFTQDVSGLYDDSVVPLCPPYIGKSKANGNSGAYDKGDMTCCFQQGPSNDRFFIRDDYAFVTMNYTAAQFKEYIKGKQLQFALATPDDPTQLTPVIDNTIQTEGGGTIDTIQTQTPVIDNCLDVGYLTV